MNTCLTPLAAALTARQKYTVLASTDSGCLQLPIALYIMWSPDFSADRIYSNTGLSFLLTTVSAGYFLYDLFVCMFRYEVGHLSSSELRCL